MWYTEKNWCDRLFFIWSIWPNWNLLQSENLKVNRTYLRRSKSRVMKIHEGQIGAVFNNQYNCSLKSMLIRGSILLECLVTSLYLTIQVSQRTQLWTDICIVKSYNYHLIINKWFCSVLQSWEKFTKLTNRLPLYHQLQKPGPV